MLLVATGVSIFPTTCFGTVEEERLIIRTGESRPMNYREDFDLDAHAGALASYLVLVARIGTEWSSNGLKEFVSPPMLLPPYCYWKKRELAASNDINIINGINSSPLPVGALAESIWEKIWRLTSMHPRSNK